MTTWITLANNLSQHTTIAFTTILLLICVMHYPVCIATTTDRGFLTDSLSMVTTLTTAAKCSIFQLPFLCIRINLEVFKI